MSLIISAARFAEICHRGQSRKYTSRPYISHPIRVAGRVATHQLATESLVAAAFLHDVVEDCGVLQSEIETQFGADVARFVFELTNTSKATTANRAERKKIDRERISRISDGAKIVKLIDRIDNLREIDQGDSFAKLYARESLLLAESLRGVDDELSGELEMICNQILAQKDKQ